MGKGDRRGKGKKQTAKARFEVIATPAASNADFAPSVEPMERHKAIRPTPERIERGTWAKMPDDASRTAPMVDLASDMIGALYASRQITSGQHDAARLFQAVLDDYLSEFGVPGYRSCLAGGVGGQDNSDGDVEAFKRHRAMQHKLGATRYLYLRSELAKGADRKPASVEMLRRALDAINA